MKNFTIKYISTFKTVLLLLYLTFFTQISNVFSQCDDKLVDKALKNSGVNTLFVREFKLKSTKKKWKLFPSTANYQVRLNEGYLYRFRVENALESEGIAILQLFEENMLLGSTFNSDKQIDEKFFDFLCKESKDYEVILSFKDHKAGCAAGVLSIVLTDSTDIKKLREEYAEEDILYTEVDNYVNIASTLKPKGKIDVSISQGTIVQEDGLYKVHVNDEGFATIKIISTDSLGKVVETTETKFKVLESLPIVTLFGKTGGIIPKSDFYSGKIYLKIENSNSNQKYTIYNFSISNTLGSTGIISQGTEYLNLKQINFLKSMKTGDSFFINDIIIQNEKGRQYKIQSLGFIIE